MLISFRTDDAVRLSFWVHCPSVNNTVANLRVTNSYTQSQQETTMWDCVPNTGREGERERETKKGREREIEGESTMNSTINYDITALNQNSVFLFHLHLLRFKFSFSFLRSITPNCAAIMSRMLTDKNLFLLFHFVFRFSFCSSSCLVRLNHFRLNAFRSISCVRHQSQCISSFHRTIFNLVCLISVIGTTVFAGKENRKMYSKPQASNEMNNTKRLSFFTAAMIENDVGKLCQSRTHNTSQNHLTACVIKVNNTHTHTL